MEERLRALAVSVAGLNARLDAVLPTLATKADLHGVHADLHGFRADLHAVKAELHEALRAQTWKLFGGALAIAGPFLAGVKLWH